MIPKVVKFDELPLNKFHVKMAALTFGAHFTDGYVLGLIGVAFILIKHQMRLSAYGEGLLGSSVLAGLFIGSLFFGWVSDYVGRQKIFLMSFVLISIASALQFFADSVTALFLYRVLLGIGLGGDYSVGHTMLAEFSPKKHRGFLLGSFSLMWTIGFASASFVGAFMLEGGENNWRLILASSTIPSLIILFLRRGTPESPLWLLSQNRIEEARAVVKKYFGENVILEGAPPVGRRKRFRVLFEKEYRTRTAFNCLFFVCLVIPYFAIYTYLPSILKSLGLQGSSHADLMLNLLLIVGALIGVWCTIVFSRRGFLIGSFIILAVLLCLLAALPVGSRIAFVLVFSVFTLLLSAASNLVGIFPAESFPTDLRSSGVGLATSVSRLGSALGTFLLPISVASLGLPITMIWLALILILGALVSFAWAPETKSLSLGESAKPIEAVGIGCGLISPPFFAPDYVGPP